LELGAIYGAGNYAGGCAAREKPYSCETRYIVLAEFVACYAYCYLVSLKGLEDVYLVVGQDRPRPKDLLELDGVL